MKIKEVLAVITILFILFNVGMSHAEDALKQLPEDILKTLPKKIETFDAEMPNTFGDKRLGASIGYNDKEDTAITAFLYDYGYADIEDGIFSEIINTSKESAIEDVKEYEKRGYYGNVKIISDGRKEFILNGKNTIDTLWTSYSYEIIDPRVKGFASVISDLYIVGLRGYICKIRVTRSEIAGDRKKQEIDEVLRTILSALKK